MSDSESDSEDEKTRRGEISSSERALHELELPKPPPRVPAAERFETRCAIVANMVGTAGVKRMEKRFLCLASRGLPKQLQRPQLDEARFNKYMPHFSPSQQVAASGPTKLDILDILASLATHSLIAQIPRREIGPVPFYFLGVFDSPAKIDQKKGTLIPTSLLEDLQQVRVAMDKKAVSLASLVEG